MRCGLTYRDREEGESYGWRERESECGDVERELGDVRVCAGNLSLIVDQNKNTRGCVCKQNQSTTANSNLIDTAISQSKRVNPYPFMLMRGHTLNIK